MEFGLRLWDTIWERADHGLVAGGYKAIDSCRLEKGYRVWGADITPRTTPTRPGSSSRSSSTRGTSSAATRSWRRRSAGSSEGSRAWCSTMRARSRSAPSRCGSTVRPWDVTSGGYGYTVERSIAYAYVPAVNAEPGRPVEVEIFGEWISGEIAREPLYDPDGSRIRT